MNYEFVKMYKHCQFKWYLQYGMGVKDNEYSPTDSDAIKELIMNTLEFDIESSTKEYYDKYPIINDLHVEEVIKVDFLEDRLHYPRGISKFNYKDVDIIVDNKDGSYDLYEVVYSKEYEPSGKLSILKYKLKSEMNIRNLKVIHFPDVTLKKLLNETTVEFRKRLLFQLDFFRPKIYDVKYNQLEVDDYLSVVQAIENNDGSELNKNIGFHCYSCEYENICKRSR